MSIAQPSAASTASFPLDFERGTRGGVTHAVKPGTGFLDFLDSVNPLRHIPVVSSLYGMIAGPPSQGTIASPVALASTAATAGNAGQAGAPAAWTQLANEAAGAPAAPAAAPPRAPQAPAVSAPRTATAPSAGKQERTGGKDIRAYIEQAGVAPSKTPGETPTPAGKKNVTSAPEGANVFADRMMLGLEKYRTLGGARPATTRQVDQQG